MNEASLALSKIASEESEGNNLKAILLCAVLRLLAAREVD